MKRHSLCFFVVLVLIFALAGVPAAVLGAAAGSGSADIILPNDILRNAEAHYQRLNAYTAQFRQRTTSSTANSITTEASGKLYYQKPRQMRWEYDTPEVQIFVANRQYAWLHVPQDKQISLFEGQSFFASPLARTFFDGIFELRKQFEVTANSKESNDKIAVLELVPREEDPHVKLLRLWISREDFRIISVETRDALGNVNRIIIEAQREVPSLDPGLFRLDVPSQTIVINPESKELSPAEIRNLENQILLQQEKR